MTRLLALLVALCCVLPGEAWARVAAACAEPDQCCCRRDGEAAPSGPMMKRFDCCEASCIAEGTSCPATLVRSDELPDPAAHAAAFAEPFDQAASATVSAPSARTRGPPRALYGLLRHRLL